LHYILEWEDFDAREAAWTSFYADAEYRRRRAEIMADGELAVKCNISFWRAMPEPVGPTGGQE
jgi:hypothetical protein